MSGQVWRRRLGCLARRGAVEEIGDVLIVGAGPAGLLTALGLGQAGLKVVCD